MYSSSVPQYSVSKMAANGINFKSAKVNGLQMETN